MRKGKREALQALQRTNTGRLEASQPAWQDFPKDSPLKSRGTTCDLSRKVTNFHAQGDRISREALEALLKSDLRPGPPDYAEIEQRLFASMIRANASADKYGKPPKGD